jgi:hypothetical protein
LLTATAAGPLLGAPWSVSQSPSPQVTEQARVVSTATRATAAEVRLADTGSFDSTPYVIGGTFFLTLGAGFVTYAVRRERLGV